MVKKNHKDSTEHRTTQWVNDLQKDITEEEWSVLESSTLNNKHSPQTGSI